MKYHSQSGSIQKKLSAPKSAYKKYRLSVTGNTALKDFIVYELLNLFIMPFPGTVGLCLRQRTYKLILQHLGRGARLEKDITLRRPQQIKMGNGVRICAGSVLDVKDNDGTIELGNHVSIGEKTIFNCIRGDLHVAEGTRIGKHARLGSLQGLTIGKQCVIGDYVYLSGAAHAFDDQKLPIIEQPLTCRGTTIIGDHVIIGEGTTISDGVHIGNNAEIASGSFVHRNIPAGAYAVGVPARYFFNKKGSADV